MVSLVWTFQCALASLKTPEGGWGRGRAVDPCVCFQPQCLFLSCAEMSPRSEGQEGRWVEGVWGLVAAAAAAPVGLGAGLRRGRGAFGLHHVGVGEYEVWSIWCGSRSRCCHHWSVQAVSIWAVHPATDAAASQTNGLDDWALKLAHIFVSVLGLLLHHHLVHLSPCAHVGAHGEWERITLLLLPGWLVALVDGQLAHGIVGNKHELQLVFLLLQGLDLFLQVCLLLLQLLSFLLNENMK